MNMSSCSKEVNPRFFNYTLFYSFLHCATISLIHLSELVKNIRVCLSRDLFSVSIYDRCERLKKTDSSYYSFTRLPVSCSYIGPYLKKKRERKAMNNQSTLLFFFSFSSLGRHPSKQLAI